MPSFNHEFLVELFRNAPALARELLQRSAGVELPRGRDEVGSADLSQVTSPAYAADALVVVRGEQSEALAAIVVEVQLAPDADKRRTWPVYVAVAGREHGCPAFLLVLCPDEGVARWAAGAIELGHPGFCLRPLVVGPGAVPAPASPADAERLPELAVLAAVARGEEEVARTAIAAVSRLAGEQANLYLDVIWAALPQPVRTALEAWMQKREYQSDFARKYVAEGEAKGEARGEARGRLAEARSSVRRVLARRGLELTPELERLVEAEVDLSRLERWLDAAAIATSLRDVFTDA